jgi:hypothetical protein
VTSPSNLLKWLGLLPAADGIVANLTDWDFMERFDLLHGFLGASPHIIGAVAFFLTRGVAVSRNKSAATDVAESRRRTGWIGALVFFVVCVILSFAPFPESTPPIIVEGRWWIAALLYLLFYCFLGYSEPELPT